MTNLTKIEEDYIHSVHQSAMQGKVLNLMESILVPSSLKIIAESSFNFVKLQYSAIKELSVKTSIPTSDLTEKLSNCNGFKIARDWISEKYPNIEPNFYDIDNIELATKELSNLFFDLLKSKNLI